MGQAYPCLVGRQADARRRVRGKADGKPRDVFLFFDNTDKLKAPGDAVGLMRRLGIAKEDKEGERSGDS